MLSNPTRTSRVSSLVEELTTSESKVKPVGFNPSERCSVERVRWSASIGCSSGICCSGWSQVGERERKGGERKTLASFCSRQQRTSRSGLASKDPETIYRRRWIILQVSKLLSSSFLP